MARCFRFWPGVLAFSEEYLESTGSEASADA